MKEWTKCLIVLLILFSAAARQPVFGESNLYDRIGIIWQHGMHGAVPEENIDLFTGNLTLRFQDIVLPGPNGFDLVIWRVYNSKICRDHFFGQGSPYQQEPYSYVGMGWSMHMGRVHNYNSVDDEPIIEFPDGRWETTYPNVNNIQQNISRDFLKYDRNNYKLYFKDGTVWTFGEPRTIYYDMTYSSDVLQVTEIENSYGHKIEIDYIQAFPIIEKITDSMGRQVDFIIDYSMPGHPKLKEIKVKGSAGQWVAYTYDVDDFDGTHYYRLDKYDPPEIPASYYTYYDMNDESAYALKKVTTSFGGTMEYEYDEHAFQFYSSNLYTRVVKEKKIKYSSSSTSKTWTYSYPTYAASTGTVTVDGPEFNTKAVYYGNPGSSPSEDGWKIGLLKEKWFTDNSYSEKREWTYEQISDNYWTVIGTNLGKIRAPLINTIIKTRNGDVESKEEYLYERDCDEYGLPTKIKYYGGTAGTTLKNYKTLGYYFESNSTFRDKYMVAPVKEENIYSSSGSKLKSIQIGYYTISGKCGAIDYIKRWRSGSTYLTWDYSYSSSDPDDITITVNLPGTAGTETYEYSYGILAELRRPGYTEFSRTISSYDSSIKTEINQHGGAMTFKYDDLGRITDIYMPTGFNDIDVDWNTTSVSIDQGATTVTKYWDGMGRDTGYKENGDGITLYYRKTLDAEGRITDENKGSISESHKYSYALNAAGNLTKITDPLLEVTTISYSDDQKTVTDANLKKTIFKYEDLPGLVSELTDASIKIAEYDYDKIGRLTGVEYNNSRSRSFSYNGLDQVTSESHPETGNISYIYDPEGNLETRSWGGTTHNLSYNSSNQLKTVNSGDETITNTYDTKGRVSKISSTKGWYRDQMYYNTLGSLTNERHYIPGMPVSAAKTIEYSYDANNNLKTIKYPDGKKVEYTNNGLNMPETVKFNSKTLVNDIDYRVNKQPSYMNITGNGTVFSASYKSAGYLQEAKLEKGGSYYYRSEYSYDDVGNITGIDDKTANNLDGTFDYDDLYRLTSASYSGGKSYGFTYDYYGNLRTAQENGVTVFDKTYTTQNRISGFDYDTRGNLEQTGSYTYSWDNKNRLSEINKYPIAETVGTFAYNERGLRYKATRLPPPGIMITAPAVNVEWFTTGTYTITWVTTGAMHEYVKISLVSPDGSTEIEEIVSSTPNSGSFQWTVNSDTPIGSYLIRVVTLDGQYAGDSEAFTIKNPSITVTSPAEGDEWVKGFVNPVFWEKEGPMDDSVKISLYSADGTTFIDDITPGTENTGSYNWIIGTEIVPGEYIIRIETLDGTVFDESGVFAIFERLIKVLSPGAGDIWVKNQGYTIRWDTTGQVDEDVDIYLLKNNIKILDIANDHPNNQTYTWLIPGDIESGDDVFQIHVETVNGQVSADSGLFSITPGYISVTAPAAGETLSYGQPYLIRWEKEGQMSTYVRIDLYKNTVLISNITAGTPNEAGSYTWEVPNSLGIGDDYKIEVRTVDDAFSGESGFFRIEEFVYFTKISEGEPVNEEAWSLFPRWIDYNKDGYFDLFVANSLENMLFTNNGDSTFTNSSDKFIENAARYSDRLAWGDIDNDGFPDLIICEDDYCRLYRNINGESFVEIAEEAGVSNSIRYGDYYLNDFDKDGFLDFLMLCCNNEAGYLFYHNNGDNTFSPVSNAFSSRPYGEQCAWGDYDNDGDLDLFIPVYSFWILQDEHYNLFFENKGNGIFEQITDSSLIIANDHTPQSRLAAWGDYNNDGFLDLYVASEYFENCLYRNNGDKTFTKILDSPIVNTSNSQPLDCQWLDIDNDGNLDLVISNFKYAANKVFYNKGNGNFIEIEDINIITNTEYSHGFSPGDYDNDGDLDIYFARNYYHNNLLFRSNLEKWDNGWIRIKCEGNQANASGIGAAVRVKATIKGNEVWQMRQITNRQGLQASFGLGDAAIIDEIEIRWPTDPVKVQVLKHIDINQVLTIPEITAKKILVKSPNGKENWNTGTTHHITWSCNGTLGSTIEEVNIELSKDGGETWSEIANSLPDSGAYSWTIPGDDVSHNCLVRISETDGSPSDTSNAPFAIRPASKITVTSPNGGEEWQAGSTQNITWTGSSGYSDVRLEYSIDNGISWMTIAEDTPDDGSYEWVVPNTPSEDCLIRIGAGDTDQDPPDVNDLPFRITSPDSLSLKVLSPNGGEILISETQHKITWTGTGSVGDVKIDYSTDNGETWTGIIETTENDGFFHWTVPGITSAACLIRLSDSSGDCTDTSDNVFSILPYNTPTISVVSPNGGEILPAESLYYITWAAAGDIRYVKIEYSVDSGGNWLDIAPYVPNEEGRYEWKVPDTPSDNCLIRVSNTSSEQSAADVSDAPFSITPLNAPVLKLTSPNGGETLYAGTFHNITWEHGISVHLKIEYSVDNSPWMLIDTSAHNDGSYDWSVPDAPSESCLIRLTEIDGDQNRTDLSDAFFTITSSQTNPLKIISPNGGESLRVGMTHNITWTTAGANSFNLQSSPSNEKINQKLLRRVQGGGFLEKSLPGRRRQVSTLKLEYSADEGATWTVIDESAVNNGLFEWTIPDEVSDLCLIRISTMAGDSAASDVSDAVFSIVPTLLTITVTSPNGGESLHSGATHVITWSSSEGVGSVNIDYSGDGGDTWQDIVKNISNTGQYDWTLPDVTSDSCIVRVGASDGDGGPTDVSDAPFSITAGDPAITVNSPEGGETYHIDDTIVIEWQTTGISGDVEILLRKADDTAGYTIESVWPHDGAPINYIIPDTVVPGDYFIRIQQGTEVGETPGFTIAEAVPTAITVTSPTAGECYYQGVTHLITWTRTEDIASTNVKIELYDSTGVNLIATIESNTENDGFYKWAAAVELQAGDYTIRVEAVDDSISGDSTVFSVYEASPIVVTSPRGGVEWYRNLTHLITWYRDEAIAGTSIDLYLYDATGTNLVKTIATAVENTGSYEWTVGNDIPDGNYLIRIETIAGIDSNNGAVFSIEQPGKLVVTAPYGCEELRWGQDVDICWYRDDTIVSTDVDINLYNAAGTQKLGDIINTENDGVFEWTVEGDMPPGDYSIRIKTIDNAEEDFSNVFSIDYPAGAASTQESESRSRNSAFRRPGAIKSVAAKGIFKADKDSEKNNKIGYNSAMELSRYDEDVKYYNNHHGPNIGNNSNQLVSQTPVTTHQSPLTTNQKSTTINKILSSAMIDTYYIWSFDGKLLAEYDQNGACVKDYIYVNNKLLAEYHPQTGKYYYHMQDQINSTRIVTDEDGNLVYSAAHGPYGDIQKEWVNTYDPKQKFSGKERESYSEVDYFGARYYDNHSYRFISVDPVRNKKQALANPQLWNLYSYCRNNPMTYIDSNGNISARIELVEHEVDSPDQIPDNSKNRDGVTRARITKLEGESVLADGKYKPEFEFEIIVDIWYVRGSDWTKAHEWRHAKDMLKAFKSQTNYLRLIEKLSFKKQSTCNSWIESAINDVGKLMQSAARGSSIRRDAWYLGIVDPIDALFDWIFGRKVSGRGIQRVQEWRD